MQPYSKWSLRLAFFFPFTIIAQDSTYQQYVPFHYIVLVHSKTGLLSYLLTVEYLFFFFLICSYYIYSCQEKICKSFCAKTVLLLGHVKCMFNLKKKNSKLFYSVAVFLHSCHWCMRNLVCILNRIWYFHYLFLQQS